MNGRPLDLSTEDDLVDSILEIWFQGTSGGLGGRRCFIWNLQSFWEATNNISKGT